MKDDGISRLKYDYKITLLIGLPERARKEEQNGYCRFLFRRFKNEI